MILVIVAPLVLEIVKILVIVGLLVLAWVLWHSKSDSKPTLDPDGRVQQQQTQPQQQALASQPPALEQPVLVFQAKSTLPQPDKPRLAPPPAKPSAASSPSSPDAELPPLLATPAREREVMLVSAPEQPPLLSSTHPSAVPSPPSAAPSSKPPVESHRLPPMVETPLRSPSLTTEVMDGCFGVAADGLAQVFADELDLDTRIAIEQREWIHNLEMLAISSDRVATNIALPALANPAESSPRRLAAALALVEMPTSAGPDAVIGVLDQLDESGRDLGVHALALAANPNVDARLLFAASMPSPLRDLWLGLLVDRGTVPPHELLVDLFRSSDLKEVARAYELLLLCPNSESLLDGLDAHMAAGPPPVREQALIVGLALGRPSAPVMAKAAARDPSLPRVCEALALLGAEPECEALAAWAARPTSPAHASWAAAMSGRRCGIEACLARVGELGSDAAKLASAGLRAVTGMPSHADPHTWWAVHQARFPAGARYLLGERLTASSAAGLYARADPRVRRSMSLELRIRSGGALWLPIHAMPSRLPRILAPLHENERENELVLDAAASG